MQTRSKRAKQHTFLHCTIFLAIFVNDGSNKGWNFLSFRPSKVHRTKVQCIIVMKKCFRYACSTWKGNGEFLFSLDNCLKLSDFMCKTQSKNDPGFVPEAKRLQCHGNSGIVVSERPYIHVQVGLGVCLVNDNFNNDDSSATHFRRSAFSRAA